MSSRQVVIKYEDTFYNNYRINQRLCDPTLILLMCENLLVNKKEGAKNSTLKN